MLRVHEQLYIPRPKIPSSARPGRSASPAHYANCLPDHQPFHENNIKMSWLALFIRKMQIYLLLSQFVSCFNNQMLCELWQISLLLLRVSTHTTLYLATLQVQHTRRRAVAHCQALHMYQPQEGLSSPHLPWYWALNPFRRWLLSDVKCSRSQFLLLMTGDGRFMPVSLEWGKIAESNKQNRR